MTNECLLEYAQGLSTKIMFNALYKGCEIWFGSILLLPYIVNECEGGYVTSALRFTSLDPVYRIYRTTPPWGPNF
jgi:hypothetical protein